MRTLRSLLVENGSIDEGVLFSRAERSRRFQVRPQTISAIQRERENVFGAVVRIGPAVPNPLACDVAERDLAEDSGVQVNAMVAILDRGQHQFGLGDVAGIEIQRPNCRARKPCHRFEFPSVGLQFPICESLWVNRRVQRDHHFGQPCPHLVVVVSTSYERQGQ